MSYSRHNHTRHHARSHYDRRRVAEQGFICVQCRQYVSCDPGSAGVQNRNHCPACLWSRHLDWRSAGDRLSVCRAAMQPIGLSTKHCRNKYASERDGELMVVHQCTMCATVIMNRIAADDSAAALLEIYEASYAHDAAFQAKLHSSGVAILTACDRDIVRRRLYGQHQNFGFS